MALLYNAGQALLSPALAMYLGYRLMVQGKSREGFCQRLGALPRLGPPPPAGRIWLQAVSAGEVAAAAPIIRHLRRRPTPPEVVLSTTTPAGQEQARRLQLDLAACCYFPFDFWPCVVAGLNRLQPTAIASVETEIWPNWLQAAGQRGVGTALVNGRFSDRGFRRAHPFRCLYRWPLRRLDALLMQSDRDAERARRLGGPEDRLRVVGNAKFEQNVPPLDAAEARRLRGELGLVEGQRLLIGGSTHPGEEAALLDAFAKLLPRFPDLRLLLAPRHLRRADEVERLIRKRGWNCRRRSRTDSPKATRAPVVLLDTMGELARLYGLATLAFVGGSLVPVGGHDVLQPLFHGVPPLFGPHMHNQRQFAALTTEAGAAVQVDSAACLSREIASLLDDAERRNRLQAAGRALIRRHAGAARDAAELLADLAAAGRRS